MADLQGGAGPAEAHGLRFSAWLFGDTYPPQQHASAVPPPRDGVVIAAMQPAHTPEQWRSRESRSGDARYDAARTAGCSAVFLQTCEEAAGDVHLAPLGQSARLPFGLWPAHAAQEGHLSRAVSAILPDYTVPSVRAFALVGRSAGEGLLRLSCPTVWAGGTPSGRRGAALATRVFAPQLEGNALRLMTCHWYDPLADRCVFATVEGPWASGVLGTDAVVQVRWVRDGAAETAARLPAWRPGASSDERSQWPPPAAPIWVRVTERRELLWVDSTGALWVAPCDVTQQ